MKFTGAVGRLDKFAGVVRKDMRQSLLTIGGRVFPLTQDLCPVKKGKLKATGRVSVRAGEKQVTCRILYGNNTDVNYAAWVHENVLAKHKVGQAKFVEVPFKGFPWLQELGRELDLRKALAAA